MKQEPKTLVEVLTSDPTFFQNTLRVISYGGGVQSTALVVLAATGRLDEVMGGPVDAALFANVGDDSEHPDTLAYVRQVAIPWAAERGLPIHELDKRPERGIFAGQTETLYKRLTHPDSRSIEIPVRMDRTGAPGRRNCTGNFKINVLARWLKEHGASIENRAVAAIGISTDEAHRANKGQDLDRVDEIVYPLLDLGLSRADCAVVISDAGLPIPPKSACYFCPLHSVAAWGDLRRDRPDLFAKAVELEKTVNDRQEQLGNSPTWFSSKLRPLTTIPASQDGLFPSDDWADGDGCESGHCWT